MAWAEKREVIMVTEKPAVEKEDRVWNWNEEIYMWTWAKFLKDLSH